MKRGVQDKIIHLLFDISVIAKAVDGVIEAAGGLLLLVFNPNQINGMLLVLLKHELAEDPHDEMTDLLLNSAHSLSTSTKAFVALFLLWHGIVKVGLVAALLRRKRWAYPLAIGAFALFLLYQLYRYTHTRSVFLLGLSMLDLCVIVVTWLEFKRLRSSHRLGGMS